MSRRGVAAGLVGVWLVALGLLLRREYVHPPGERLAEAALTLPPGATYFAVTLAGTQIGYASNTLDTLADTLRVVDVVVLEMPVLGEVQRTEARTEVLLSRSLTLRSFTATVRGIGMRFAAEGRVDGDSVLEVTLVGEESREVRRLPLTEPIVLPQLLPLRIAFGGELDVGRSYDIRLFDPVLMAARTLTVEVAAESTFIVPQDTAVFDQATGRWRPVVLDTLQACWFADAGVERAGEADGARPGETPPEGVVTDESVSIIDFISYDGHELIDQLISRNGF